MAYYPLARRYRPRSFSELIGQPHVVDALAALIRKDEIHPAIVFSGTRGVGKTSLARIFAAAVNCLDVDRGSRPCGRCDSCQALVQGNLADLIEIDGASRTKVEDTRALLETVPYAPLKSRFKVYVIDEAHMLSQHSFNALLKTLEEPPAHVLFVLATTEPSKIPATILSRCLHFVLHPLSEEVLEAHLRHVLEKESIAFEESALRWLLLQAEGSVRDALSLLEQVVHVCGQTLTEEKVLSVLGGMGQEALLEIMRQLASGSREALAHGIERVRQSSVRPSSLLDQLWVMVHHLALLREYPNKAEALLPACWAQHHEAFLECARLFEPETLQVYYQILLQARRDAPFAPSARMALEMTLLRLALFQMESPEVAVPSAAPTPAPASPEPLRPVASEYAPNHHPPASTSPRESFRSAVQSLEAIASNGLAPKEPSPAAPKSASVSPKAQPSVPPLPSKTVSSSTVSRARLSEALARHVESSRNTEGESEPSRPAPTSSKASSQSAAAEKKDAHEQWLRMLPSLELKEPLLTLAEHSRCASWDAAGLHLFLDPRLGSLLNEHKRAGLESVLSAHLKRNIRLHWELGLGEGLTYAEQREQETRLQREQALAQLKDHPEVTALESLFEAVCDTKTLQKDTEACAFSEAQ